MDADRLFTVACAKRDFGQSSSEEVFARLAKDELVSAFRDRRLDAELAPTNTLHRVAEWRKLGEPGRRPSERPIGKLTTEGRRAYLWLDDGSVHEEALGRPVVWLFGAGPRISDSDHRDFHHQLGRTLMLDPDDSWRPTLGDDYPALFAMRADQESLAGVHAVAAARDYALSHPNVVVPVKIPRLEARLGEVHWEETAAGVVMDDLHFRYFALARRYSSSHEYLPEEEALIYAQEAFDGLDSWGAIQVEEIMLEGMDLLSDADFYCYAADLGAQP